MSEVAIAALQRRVEELTTENATLKGEAKDRRLKGKKLQEQLDALTTEHAKAVKERGEFEAAAKTAPDEWKTKHDDLAKQVVARDHRDAFRAVGEFKVKVKGEDGKDVEKTYTLHNKAGAEKVWAEIGYRAEGDVPAAEKITEAYGKALEAAPYLFSEKVETTTPAPRGAPGSIQTPRVTPGPGSGRGVNEPPNSARSTVDVEYGARASGRIA